jgi:hypothetical protein
MATVGVNGWRFPTYTDSPDVPRDLGILGTDIAAFIAANPGPQGASGPANVLTVAATNTINPGQSASVTISGTSPSQSLTFNIPRGIDGVLGGPGPANTLSVGTVSAGAAGTQPAVTITGLAPSQTINFTIPRGDTGLTGATGSTGATGPKGDPAATITVAPTVTTSAAGTNASVTNSGTSSDVVLNFTIPRGADGLPGADGADGADGAPGATGPAGANANIDPISTRIGLNYAATDLSVIGVNSSWFPLTNNIYSLGLMGPLNSGPDRVTRGWKNIYLNSAATVISDERTKENITTSDLGLAFINNLTPVKYNKIGGERTHYGLIAQQVKSVLDEANIADFGGWVISDVNDPEGQQALRYEEFISPLIKAVQELTARVKSLEEK